jgi:hypothetical protein
MSPIQQNEPAIEPAFLPIPAACTFLGLRPTSIYRLVGLGKLQAVKAGGRTLLVMQSLRDYAASLPPAEIKTRKRLGDPIRQRKSARKAVAARRRKADDDAAKLRGMTEQSETEAA